MSGLLCVIIFINATENASSGCDAPFVGGHTGAPGETGCNGCHPGTLNSGPAQLNFDLGTNSYNVGQTYTGTVRISQPGMQKFGFSALALKNSNNTSIGSFNLTEAVRTRTYTDGPRKYVSHTPCGADSLNANCWAFTWTAPQVNEGPITLYLGLLAANHNHSTSGDFSYSDSIVLNPAPFTALIENSQLFTAQILPDPSNLFYYIQTSIAYNSEQASLTVLDMSGKTVFFTKYSGSSYRLNVSGWERGIYVLHLKQGKSELRKRILVY